MPVFCALLATGDSVSCSDPGSSSSAWSS